MQSKTATWDSATSGSITLDTGATAGNGLLAFVSAYDPLAIQAPAITMPTGWQDSGEGQIALSGSSMGIQAFILPNVAGGLTTITVTADRTSHGSIIVYEINNLPPAFVLESSGSGKGASAAPSVSLRKSVKSFDLIIDGFQLGSGGTSDTFTPTGVVSAGLLTAVSAHTNLNSDYRSASSSGGSSSVTGSGTLASSDNWGGIIVAFDGSAAGAIHLDAPTQAAIRTIDHADVFSTAAMRQGPQTSAATVAAVTAPAHKDVTTAAAVVGRARKELATAAAIAYTGTRPSVLHSAVTHADATTSVTVNFPATNPASALVVVLSVYGNPIGAVTPPAGWQDSGLGRVFTAGGTAFVQAFTLANAAAGLTSATFTLDRSGYVSLAYYEIAPAYTTGNVLSASGSGNGATASAAVSTSVAVGAQDLVIAGFQIDNDGDSAVGVSGESGWTAVRITSTGTNLLAEYNTPGAGTASPTATIIVPDQWAGIVIAIAQPTSRADLATSAAIAQPKFANIASTAGVSGRHTTDVTTTAAAQGRPLLSLATAAVITTPTRAAVASTAALATTNHTDLVSTATISRRSITALDSAAAVAAHNAASLLSIAAITLPPTQNFSTSAAISHTGARDVRSRATIQLLTRVVGIPSGEAVGIPGAVHPTGIPSSEAFGAIKTSADQATAVSGVVSQEAVGSPTTMIPGIYPVGIPSGEALGNPTTTGGVIASNLIGIGSGEAFGVLTTTASAPTITVEGIGLDGDVGDPITTLSVIGGGVATISSLERFGVPFIYGGTLGSGPPIVAQVFSDTREPLDLTGRRPQIDGVELATADNVVVHRVADGGEFTLTFDIVATDPNRSLVQEDVLVAIPALYNFDFTIRRVEDDRGQDGKLKTTVSCEAPHYNLGYIAAWDINWDHTDPSQVMGYLLNNGVYSTGWYPGVVQFIDPTGPSSSDMSFYGEFSGGSGNDYVDDDFRLSFSAKRISVLAGLTQVAQTWGGYLFFHEDTHIIDLVLDWGNNTGLSLDWTRNLKNLKRTVEKKPQSQIMLVEGVNGAIAGLTSANLIAQIDSGMLSPDPCESNGTRKVFNSELASETEAQDYLYAQLLLQQQAQVSYQAGVVDLSLLPAGAPSIHLGDWVTVTDAELGIADKVRVVQEDYNVLEPWKSTYQLSNVIPSLSQRSHTNANKKPSKTPANCDSQPPVLQDGKAPDVIIPTPDNGGGSGGSSSDPPHSPPAIAFDCLNLTVDQIGAWAQQVANGIATAQQQLADAQAAQQQQQKAQQLADKMDKQNASADPVPAQIADNPQNANCDAMGHANGDAVVTGATTIMSSLSTAAGGASTLSGLVGSMQGTAEQLGQGDPGSRVNAALTLLDQSSQFAQQVGDLQNTLAQASTGLSAVATGLSNQSTEICGASQHVARTKALKTSITGTKAEAQKALAKAKASQQAAQNKFTDLQNQIADMQALLSAIQAAKPCVDDAAVQAADAAALETGTVPLTPAPVTPPDVPTPDTTPAADGPQDCVAAAIALMNLLPGQVTPLQQALQQVQDFADQLLQLATQVAATESTPDIAVFGSSIDDLVSRCNDEYAAVGRDALDVVALLGIVQNAQQQASAGASPEQNAVSPIAALTIAAAVNAIENTDVLAQTVSNHVGQMVADEIPASGDMDAIAVYLQTLMDYAKGVVQRSAATSLSDGWQNLDSIYQLALQISDLVAIIPAAFAVAQGCAASVGNLVSKAMSDADCVQSVIGTAQSDVNQQQDINALANSSWQIDTPNTDTNPVYTGDWNGGSSGGTGDTYSQILNDGRMYAGGTGRQRLSVRDTAPDNPQEWDVWIDTSQVITPPTPPTPPTGGMARPIPEPVEHVQVLRDGTTLRSIRRTL